MNRHLFSSLLGDFWSDLSDPGVAWQIATLLGCGFLGWALAKGLKASLGSSRTHTPVVQLGVESFSRVLSPLIALGLIALSKPILARYHHINLLRVAIPLVASFALIRLVFYILRRIFARGRQAGSMLLLVEKVLAVTIWLCVALYVTGVWPDLIQVMEDTVVPVGRYKTSVLAIVQAIASVTVTVVLALWAAALLEDRLMHVTNMHSSLRTVFARLGRALLILVAILVSLSLVGIDLTVLSVFGGALGVGIGLGLQKIVGSYISGFVILLERSLAIGDMVTVDKYYGRVTRINTRYTVIRSLDGIETVVPNDLLISGPVQNYSLSDRVLRLTTSVVVGYDTDIEATLVLLEEGVSSIDRVSKDLLPSAVLLRLGSDGFEVEVGFWIADPENGRTNVLSDVNRLIWRLLKSNGIRVPYPQRELHIVGGGEAELLAPESAGGKVPCGNI